MIAEGDGIDLSRGRVVSWLLMPVQPNCLIEEIVLVLHKALCDKCLR